MIKPVHIKILCLSAIFCLAQYTNAQEIDDYYKKGVEAFKKMEYKKSDSLFTLSIKQKPNNDNYFNRAMARTKFGFIKGA